MINFNEKYNRQEFLNFLGKFLPDDFKGKIEENIQTDRNFQKIKQIHQLGEVKSLGTSRPLKIYEIRHTSENDPRVTLTREAFWLLSAQHIRRALIVFISENSDNYRFSLMTIELKDEGQQVRQGYSNPRRYSFYLGPDAKVKTPTDFLIKKGKVEGFDDLLSRFDVEVVTKEFFEKFRLYFQKTKEEFEKTNKNTVCLWLKDRYLDEEYKEQINKFVYTFLGRIIFIYFLQRKGWIENQKDFVKRIIEDKENNLLYLNFFQPLFFNVFAKKEEERPRDIKEKYKDTPYLNGGLFERSELERQLEKEGKFILFDDKFIRDIILNFFEVYNFTIDENSPDDQEVSIDPEMLGKIFENTLTEEERGKKGTFYTPREIVHFMVKDSLWQFLNNETGIDAKKLHQLIYNEKEIEELELTKEQIRLIDKKLENIKVLDSVVGSAAFPVETMQILVGLRERLNVNVGKNINEVSLKKKFIKNNLYGVDIDPGAIEIAKLRLWLALIVDYNKAEHKSLPNLDFQFRLGNSLQEKIDDIDIFNDGGGEDLFSSISEFDKLKKKMIETKFQFYDCDNETKKRKLKKEFDDLERRLIQAVLDKYKDQLKSQIGNVNTLIKGHKNTRVQKEIDKTIQKINNLEQKIKDGTYKLFKPDFHFSEVFDRKDEQGNKIGGFDIVIGNPPYGVKVENDIKEWHGLGSKDSYGVFISTSLKRFLKPGGVLSFIVSDTWLTIKTHKPLREQVLEKQLHKVIRLHQDCFDATVNACIMSVTNSQNNNGNIIAADLTNISTRKEVEELREKLYHLEKFISQSTPKFAVYKYRQNLIKTNSNLPIFVGSPKLFALMNDTTCPVVEKEINGTKIKVRQIKFNGKVVELVRFGDIAEIKQGLTAGDNKKYLFQNPEARGNYKNINDYKKYLLTEKDLEQIRNNEELRLKVIERGFHKSRSEEDFDEDLWFGGRYIVPYDKGGESDVDSGFLPAYYVLTNYFFDWSCDSIKSLNKSSNYPSGKRGKTFWRNKNFYFKLGLSYSFRGYYSPTFRLNSKAVIDVNGPCIFSRLDNYFLLGLLNSKLVKFLFKNYIQHTIASDAEPIGSLNIYFKLNNKVINIVSRIIKKQKQNPRYDYMSNEQKEIDKLVYKMYGLGKDDIREVETWYARRYPKLARFCDL